MMDSGLFTSCSTRREASRYSSATLATWRRAVALPLGAPAGAVLITVRERLADDLDTPGALAAVDAWAAASLAGAEATDVADDWDEQSPTVVGDLVDALLGIALSA